MRQRIMIGFPVGGSVHPAFTKALLDLQRFELEHPSESYELLPIEYSSSLYVEENRNILVELAQTARAEWLLQLDTDESFKPDLLRQLMTHADADERPIVFGVYSNIMRAPEQTEGAYYHVDMLFQEQADGQYKNIPPQHEHEPFFVDAAGTGCCLTHISIYDQIAFPWFTLDWIVPTGKTRPQVMNEDISFCRKARQAGYQLLVDPLAEVTHYKTLALLPSAFRGFMERAKKVQEELKALA